MNRFLALTMILLTCSVTGCIGSMSVAPTPTAAAQHATVTDLSAPFATSENDALVARGFLGRADLGRLDSGCSVEVIKTTDRAAQVKLLSCPSSPNTAIPVPTATVGWVAKSALDIKP